MNEDELYNKVSFLLNKYLIASRAEEVFEDFQKGLRGGQNFGKEMLHILSSEKNMDFDDVDKNLIKEVAYHLGI